jgi:hypothetical protein
MTPLELREKSRNQCVQLAPSRSTLLSGGQDAVSLTVMTQARQNLLQPSLSRFGRSALLGQVGAVWPISHGV